MIQHRCITVMSQAFHCSQRLLYLVHPHIFNTYQETLKAIGPDIMKFDRWLIFVIYKKWK